MPIDPVCRKHVDIPQAAASYDYEALAVYFCSVECAKKFEKDPESYMKQLSDEEKMAS